MSWLLGGLVQPRRPTGERPRPQALCWAPACSARPAGWGLGVAPAAEVSGHPCQSRPPAPGRGSAHRNICVDTCFQGRQLRPGLLQGACPQLAGLGPGPALPGCVRGRPGGCTAGRRGTGGREAAPGQRLGPQGITAQSLDTDGTEWAGHGPQTETWPCAREPHPHAWAPRASWRHGLLSADQWA